MFELVGGHQVVLELVAQVNVNLIKAAFAVAELFEVQVDVFPLRVLLVRLVLEVVEKTALHLLLVEEVVSFVDDALETTAAQGLGLLAHAVVVVLLALRLRLGVDVDAETLVAHNLHSALVPVARVIVQVKGQLFSAFDFPCSEGHGLTNVTHIPYYILMNILGEASLHGVKITSLCPDYQHYYA